jgi:hypothetical protein
MVAPSRSIRRTPLAHAALIACAAGPLAGLLAGAQAQTAPAQTIEIIGTSPLPGQGTARELLPYATTLLRRRAIDAAQAENSTDLLARRVAGAQVNDIQGSPFQADLTFRGHRASGLIGAAQGLSVYLDGIRINEPFGDVVNWDLVPEFALDSIALVPGANPAFGLNTLGGAIAMQTTDGLRSPGWRFASRLGSFGRVRVDLSQGGGTAEGHHYVAVGGFREDGWRDHSAGHLGQLFARAGRRLAIGDFSVSLLLGRSRLVGNGLVPLDNFDDDGERSPDLGRNRREAVYTHPDLTRNELAQIGLGWQTTTAAQQRIEALAYLRNSKRTTINGDEAEEEEEVEAGATAGLSPRRATSALRARPLGSHGQEANASFNRTATQQRGGGAALAWSGRSGAQRWQLGASIDAASVRYEQTEQEGSFDDTRGVDPIEGEEPELSAAVRGSTLLAGVYGSSTWSLAEGTHLTGTLRLNHARTSNQLTSVDDDTGAVEVRERERFSYRSANPALGIVHRLSAPGASSVYANLARNTRVPTVIELGCADPEEPCRLPAGLQADPYLKQVRSTSIEAGWRFGSMQGAGGSVNVFRIDNRDDILFRSVSIAGQQGYFENFPRTRHQGAEVEWRWRSAAVDLELAYAYLHATYQASGTLRVGERNVEVTPGTRIAGLPRQQLKVNADWRPAAGWTVGAELQAVSRRVTAGNEDGRLEDGGERGFDFSLPGYGVVHLRAAWTPRPGLEFGVQISNVFNRRSASFGALAETLFDPQGNLSGDETDALFVAPGTPRAISFTARLRF